MTCSSTVCSIGDDNSASHLSAGQASLVTIRKGGPLTKLAICGTRLQVAEFNGTSSRAWFASVLSLGDNLAVSSVNTLCARFCAGAPCFPLFHDAVNRTLFPVTDLYFLQRRANETAMTGGLNDGPGAGVGTRTTGLGALRKYTPSRDLAVNRAGAHVAFFMIFGSATRFATVGSNCNNSSVPSLRALPAARLAALAPL